MSEESKRIAELREDKADWQLWGSYLSERQWGNYENSQSTIRRPHDGEKHLAALQRFIRAHEPRRSLQARYARPSMFAPERRPLARSPCSSRRAHG